MKRNTYTEMSKNPIINCGVIRLSTIMGIVVFIQTKWKKAEDVQKSFDWNRP
jgi:hypothetical protein